MFGQLASLGRGQAEQGGASDLDDDGAGVGPGFDAGCAAAGAGDRGHGSALLAEQALAEADACTDGEDEDGVDCGDEWPQGPFAALHVGLLPPAPGWGFMGGSEIVKRCFRTKSSDALGRQ
ncbi:hypothetical protein SMG44B_40078 [Stenotrophomonas maltophilia]